MNHDTDGDWAGRRWLSTTGDVWRVVWADGLMVGVTRERRTWDHGHVYVWRKDGSFAPTAGRWLDLSEDKP